MFKVSARIYAQAMNMIACSQMLLTPFPPCRGKDFAAFFKEHPEKILAGMSRSGVCLHPVRLIV